jgi:hypothetical protein
MIPTIDKATSASEPSSALQTHKLFILRFDRNYKTLERRYLLFAPGSRVFTNSEIALACASLMPGIPLSWGAFEVAMPFMVRSMICSAVNGVPLSAGTFIFGFPSPSEPWQPAHFDL